MAIYLVTYDLRQPGRDYTPVHAYLKAFTHCKGMESVWLLDTQATATAIRDGLMKLIDANDRLFVARLQGEWGSYGYNCADWLNNSSRNW